MSSIVRYDHNPFLDKSSISTKSQRIIVGSGNNVLVDRSTGEEHGTVVASFREVDKEAFVKIFAQNIGSMMNFTAAGVKAFTFLIWAVSQKIGQDIVILDQYQLEDFMKEQPSDFIFSDRSMRMGVVQLEAAKIVAKAQRRGHYYINPHFLFNGDRVTFAQQIRLKSSASNNNEEQQEMFD